ncbi:hypothetical protein [Paenibacillus typhae]|uniref:hypothetical protein n=1 Tax=Paenibacillus typhae TaxID=1174501 RepID=UPI001C8F1BA7|nr:hypothetical protein [Paenibacillus typhae]MBY0011516.1 hypothetical protein [Paenibacillus typhae]
MDKEAAIDKLAKEWMEQYPGKHDGRYRRAAALGHIDAIVESGRSPYAKVRDIKIVLAALNITDESAL